MQSWNIRESHRCAGLSKTWKELTIISSEEDGHSYFDDHRIYIDKKKHQHKETMKTTVARSYLVFTHSSPHRKHDSSTLCLEMSDKRVEIFSKDKLWGE